jgi:hypothetical protein
LSEEITSVIGRLRRAQPRNLDTMAVCDELEKRLRVATVPNPCLPKTLDLEPKSDLGRNAYQRQYMRDMRAAKKLGMATEAYRAQKAST